MNRNAVCRTLGIVNIIAVCLLLSSCSLLSPVNTGPTTTYVLNAVPSVANRYHAHPKTLLVTQPESNAIYNTTKMAYTVKPYQVAYFAKNDWAETPAKMLQPLMVQALQNTRHFRAISPGPFFGRYDLILNTQLLELQQSFVSNRSFVQLTLRAQLIKGDTGKVIAAKEFSVVETAPQNNPYGGVVAANRAVAEMLRQLTLFCLHASE